MEIFGQKSEDERKIASAKDSEWVAENFGMPKRVDPLELLSDTSISCLTRIAENTSVPPTMLEQLALHCDAKVREAVADNANTPLETLWVLAGDESADVRYAMAENHNIPEPILCALSMDDNPYISTRAQATINRIQGSTLISGHFPTASAGDRVSKFG